MWVLVLKNCEPELLHLLVELFKMYLKESYFQDLIQKVSSVDPVFKNLSIWGGIYSKKYHPVSLLSVVNKIFAKLANNRLVCLFNKLSLFSDFQFDFKPF